jgi:predicted RNase H-like HicB family nuclease
MKREIIFEVREEPEGGYSAEAIGESIFTEGDTWEELRAHVQDATRLHFEGEEMPDSVRLVLRREETLAVA